METVVAAPTLQADLHSSQSLTCQTQQRSNGNQGIIQGMDQQQGRQGSSGDDPGQRRSLPVVVIHVRIAPAGCGDQGIEAANVRSGTPFRLAGEIARRAKGSASVC